jgi:hypothetical protein
MDEAKDWRQHKDSMSAREERSKYRDIGCVKGPIEYPSVTCDFYAEFMRKSGMKNTGEWAERFARGKQFHAADIRNQKIMLEIMVDGPGDGTAAFINEEAIKQLVKERGY